MSAWESCSCGSRGVFFVKQFGWSSVVAPVVVGSALAASGPSVISDERVAERERAAAERAAEWGADRDVRNRRAAEERVERDQVAADERAERRQQEAEELAALAAGALDLSPEDLLQMFALNEIGAADRLSRRAVLITGTVGAVRAAEGWSLSSAYIQFADGLLGLGSVNAYFVDDLPLRNLTAGVVVSTVCDGRVAREGLNVELRGCQPLW